MSMRPALAVLCLLSAGAATGAIGNLTTQRLLGSHSPRTLLRAVAAAGACALLPFVDGIARADHAAPFAAAGLPGPIAAATVVWRGALTPEYEYLAAHLR